MTSNEHIGLSPDHAGPSTTRRKAKVADDEIIDSFNTDDAEAGFKCGAPYRHLPRREEGVDYWARILEPVHKKDTARCNAWKEEVQNILIFAGLFSAVVTAFLVESYKTLKQDPNDTMVSLLTHIAARLDNPSILTLGPVPSPTQFVPTSSAIRVNIVWFFSLVLSLTTVLVGIVSLQWLREHQSYPEDFTPEKTFTLLHMRTEMLEKWRVSALFTSLPIFLQFALGLFLGGLAEFLASLGSNLVTAPVVILIGLSLAFLLATTVLPTVQLFTISNKSQINREVPVPCPYKSPQAQLFRSIISLIFIPACSLSLRFTAILWSCLSRDNNAESKTHSSFSMFATPLWTDLDIHWLSVRRSFAFQLLCGGSGDVSNFKLHFSPHAWKKDVNRGPFYDQIRGIYRLSKQYPYDHDILLSAFHCFIGATSWTINPGQFIVDVVADKAPNSPGGHYYRALANMMGPTEALIPSAVIIEAPPAVLYDEAVILFLSEIAHVEDNTPIFHEISLRLLNFLSSRQNDFLPHVMATQASCKPFGFTERMHAIGLPTELGRFSEPEKRGITGQAYRTLKTVLAHVTSDDGALPIKSQLISYRGLAALLERCILAEDLPQELAPAAQFMKSTFDHCSTLANFDYHLLELIIKVRLIPHFLSTMAIVKAYHDLIVSDIAIRVEAPREVIQLGQSLLSFCQFVFDSKSNRHVHKMLETIEGVAGCSLMEVARCCVRMLYACPNGVAFQHPGWETNFNDLTTAVDLGVSSLEDTALHALEEGRVRPSSSEIFSGPLEVDTTEYRLSTPVVALNLSPSGDTA